MTPTTSLVIYATGAPGQVAALIRVGKQQSGEVAYLDRPAALAAMKSLCAAISEAEAAEARDAS